MMASRDNEIAASASGVNLAAVKTISFGVSGALTGVGGSLFAMYLGSLVANDSFTLLNAIALLTGLVIGGEATRFGPILGGLAVVYIPYYTSQAGPGRVGGRPVRRGADRHRLHRPRRHHRSGSSLRAQGVRGHSRHPAPLHARAPADHW